MSIVFENSVEVSHRNNVSSILDTAERLFRHLGYTKTTVADIARELDQSPANIYRFFRSKVEIQQAICARLLAESYQQARDICGLPLSSSERLARLVSSEHYLALAAARDCKLQKLVIVAMEQDWHVIDAHIDRLYALLASVIREGIVAGEFPMQDADLGARCFAAAATMFCHPHIVAQYVTKKNRATLEEIIDFAIGALKMGRVSGLE